MVDTSKSNINHAIERLTRADESFSSPAIYLLWAGLVALSFLVAGYSAVSSGMYWLVALPVGMLLSAWIGYSHSKKIGQRNAHYGKSALAHFSIMAVFMLAGALGDDPAVVLLILGFAYCLGGIYLDKLMMIFGLCTLLAYIGIATNVIQSNVWLGVLLTGGLLATALVSALRQKTRATRATGTKATTTEQS